MRDVGLAARFAAIHRVLRAGVPGLALTTPAGVPAGVVLLPVQLSDLYVSRSGR